MEDAGGVPWLGHVAAGLLIDDLGPGGRNAHPNPVALGLEVGGGRRLQGGLAHLGLDVLPPKLVAVGGVQAVEPVLDVVASHEDLGAVLGELHRLYGQVVQALDPDLLLLVDVDDAYPALQGAHGHPGAVIREPQDRFGVGVGGDAGVVLLNRELVGVRDLE